jgi:ABC-2 type transport system ATP-binding protein
MYASHKEDAVMSVVLLEEVSRRFGDVRAVDKVSLSIEKGEIFGLLGPNGAGKSTAINLLTGLLSLDAGRATVLGHDVSREPMAVKRAIGVVPQELAIYDDLTTLENVRFFAGLYGMRGPALAAGAEEALEFTGLLDKAKEKPKGFSGGMRRRLNIACAIAHKPALIVMDEPTVGIDPQTRSHILQSVRVLNSRGCTVIYTTHYMEEAEEICGRIAIMDHGKVIAEGTRPELEALISDTNVVWVTIADGGRVSGEALRAIPGVTAVEIEEGLVKVSSAREVNVLEPIIQSFAAQRIPLRAIESKTPDLETVFLSLTGRSLRD